MKLAKIELGPREEGKKEGRKEKEESPLAFSDVN